MDNTLGVRVCGFMVFGYMCDQVIALWVLTYIYKGNMCGVELVDKESMVTDI